MKPITKLLILVVILAVLLGTLWAIQKRTQIRTSAPLKLESAPFFPDLSADKVYRIGVSTMNGQGKESLLFRKSAGVWEVSRGIDAFAQMLQNQGQKSTAGQESVGSPEGAVSTGQTETLPQNDVGPSGDPYRAYFKADADKTKALVDAVVKMQRGELVTSDPNKKSQFKIIPQIQGTEITLYDEQMNKLADFIIGDSSPDRRSTYVQRPGSNDIYEVPDNLKMLFEAQLASVRSKSIFTASPETFMTVNIKDSKLNTGTTLSRVEGAWQGSNVAGVALQLSTAQVDNFLSSLGTLSANSFVDKNEPPSRTQPPPTEPVNPDDPYGLKAPALEISFTTSDNIAHSLIVGKTEGTVSYAIADGRTDDVFKISNTTIALIRPTPEQLEGKVVPPTIAAPADSAPAQRMPMPPTQVPMPPPGGGG